VAAARPPIPAPIMVTLRGTLALMLSIEDIDEIYVAVVRI
jgi:hypothetical protein